MKTEDIDKIIAESLEKEKKASKWHRPEKKKSNKIAQVRQVLNAVFMLGFLAAVIIYFAMPENRMLFFCVGFGAMAVKIVEFIIRFLF
ncbi:MAG: hypothetical protein IJ910_06605 [Bacteroidaceae bacterium]|nr:hypothetical protein [Bacteroidaceae bacterium]